ncbi:MAG: hypothetical protein WKF51_12225 [Geodermatophilaceae bacterium]
MEIAEVPPQAPKLCEWIEPGLREIAGQDPLGLQTITTDRILPALLPGVLALSRRARYLSIYAFLLRRYAQSAGRADNAGLDLFIRGREFELSVAANLCANPDCLASGASGNLLTRPLVAAAPDAYERTLSIKTALGGFGLYYRSPMEELGLVIPAGWATVEGEPTPIDLLAPTARAQDLADEFESAIADTRWYGEWMHGVDPVPADVLEELAARACLCRLGDFPAERTAIRTALLEPPSPERAQPTEQRRRAFALVLDGISREPDVARSDEAFRRDLVYGFEANPAASSARGEAQAQWGAMAMRECTQDAIASIWHHFCRAGLAEQPFEGFTRAELNQFIDRSLIGIGTVKLGTFEVTATVDTPTEAWVGELEDVAVGDDWEQIRKAAANADDALTGLAMLVLLCARTPSPDTAGPAWTIVADVDGEHQPGLRRLAGIVNRQLAFGPTVGELLRWVVRTFVITVHDTVATSKLPVSTFRFFWEHGRLRFVDNGVWRFDTSGLRRDALVTIAFDLGWWQLDANDAPALTPDGEQVIAGVFGT